MYFGLEKRLRSTMSVHPSIGVANSVSANHNFDPLDALAYAKQSNFDSIQIYLNDDLLSDEKELKKIKKANFPKSFYHAEGLYNTEFAESDYKKKLYSFLAEIETPNFISHFDETSSIDSLIKLTEELSKGGVRIYLENYFSLDGKEDAEKNLKKYLALFTLSSNFGNPIYPVLDIPRLFNKKVGFTVQESMEWTFQLVNFFGNRRMPILFHLIDATTDDQPRSSFCTLGEGYIPYDEIFNFLKKTRPAIESIILEYEDKINPLNSREFIQKYYGG